ncbi:MAG TPA: enoyl-CoA hydratase-related protein [Anaerolineae bacterium]|nr:enoyl-CoA hydratase-related protein [Anaerolineae bacterium]HPL27646.1 enoyl-CoA hydratase-related protein [Anaerolineae bacterium]
MDIKTVGVVGCGLMGSGIAQTVAEGGFTTIVREPTQELLDKGLERIRSFLAKGVDKGKTTPARRDEVWACIRGTTDMADLADCDLVIEAIVENRDAKKAVFAELDRICKPSTVFATNTSSFRVAEIAAATKRPHLVGGLHYFYPPVINKLLEVIRTNDTAPEAFEMLLSFGRLSGKLPILVRDSPGFAVNRFFIAWYNEAIRLLDEGVANIPTIDVAVCEAFGLGMGPYKLINVSGVPLAYHAAVSLTESIGDFYRPARHLRQLYESGQLWDLSGEVDPARKQAVADRLLAVVCGVAARVAEEGVATVEDVDRGATIGLRWAKGPFAIMNDMGLERALALMGPIEDAHPGFIPDLLRQQVASGQPWTLRHVRLAIDGAIAHITMSRPEALNALGSKVLHELKDALAQVRANRAVRAVILSGEGDAFIAGADIKEMQALAARPAAIREFTELGLGVLRDIETLPQPVIAAINGFALGGGLELALACDIRIASSTARLGFPEVGLGIMPGLGGTQRATRLAGRGVASELVLTGDLIGAEEAARVGLVNRVVAPPQLMATARRLADRIASRAPVAVAKSKAAILATQRLPLDEGLAFELDRSSEVMATPDRVEGMQAFIDKRPPVFTGTEPQ